MDADDGKKPIKRKSRGMTQKSMVIKNRSKGINLLIKYNQDEIFVGDICISQVTWVYWQGQWCLLDIQCKSREKF